MEQPFPTTAVIFLHGKEISVEISKAASMEQRLPDHLNSCTSGFLHSCQNHSDYPKGLIFIGKHEQFTCSMAPLHTSARTRGRVVRGSQVVEVSCRVARWYSCPESGRKRDKCADWVPAQESGRVDFSGRTYCTKHFLLYILHKQNI